MSVSVTPLSPNLGARVTDVSLTGGLNEGSFAAIRDAFDTYSVLVFPDQPMNDEQQVEFSKRFGPLEISVAVNPGKGTPFARQSNLDIKTGDMIPPDDRRMFYQKANMLWHADSTFKDTLSLCSILTARKVPPEGGATEFVSTRAAYDELSAERKAELEDLVVEHSFIHSRGLVGFTFTPEEAAHYPAVRHRLVQVNPANGRRSLTIGVHASHIVGWPLEKGRALLDELMARATRPEKVMRHEWSEGDLIIWDNRAALHRATPYDATRHARLMQRTTISTGVPSRL